MSAGGSLEVPGGGGIKVLVPFNGWVGRRNEGIDWSSTEVEYLM